MNEKEKINDYLQNLADSIGITDEEAIQIFGQCAFCTEVVDWGIWMSPLAPHFTDTYKVEFLVDVCQVHFDMYRKGEIAPERIYDACLNYGKRY